jgi:glyoxylase-like metal-dependent hydrolase (beta-lactamase superfamily II)
VIHTVDTEYTDRTGVAAAFVVEHEGGVYVCETNTSYAVPAILRTIEASGHTPEQVTHVIITHIHLDHAGGASALMKACPNATLLAHPRAAPHAIDPSRIVAGASAVYGEARFAELYGTIEPIDAERVRAMDHDEALEVGGHRLRFLHTRGHANHHMVVVDEAEEAVFTGDSFGIAYPDVQPAGTPAHRPTLVFPSTSPTDFDADAARESLRTIVGTGATSAWLTHFGRLDNLDDVATSLDAQLARYGALVDELDASDLEGDALHARAASVVDGFFAELLPEPTGEQAQLLDLDRDLNGQGVAVAVERRRYRRARAARA